jgi:general secretion pathway protein I
LKGNKPFLRIQKQYHGFTLLEIMVSISIIGIVFIAIYEMHFTTLTMTQTTQFSTTAPTLAQQKIAQFELSAFEDLTEMSGDFGETYPGYRWKIAIDPVDSQILGNISTDMKKIDLTIFQSEDRGTFFIRTYRLLR